MKEITMNLIHQQQHQQLPHLQQLQPKQLQFTLLLQLLKLQHPLHLWLNPLLIYQQHHWIERNHQYQQQL